MPRQLLRDRQISADDWQYANESLDAPALILELDQFQQERDAWLKRGIRLGVILKPEHAVESLLADLPHLQLVAARFSGPGEGRGYTQAKLLRERYDFQGEIRAIGYARTDQLIFMARCGFNSFEMSEADLQIAAAAFSTFSLAYQPSNDQGLAAKLRRFA